MSKAFLDTTIVADVLLKPGPTEASTKAALAGYRITELPVYAIKEFKAGPLKNYIWFHNKLVSTKSFQDSITGLQRMSLTPKRYTTATALDALRAAAYVTRNLTGAAMVDRYGQPAIWDRFLCDRYRLALRTLIESAWRRRRRIALNVVIPIPCYSETAPFEENGLLKVESLRCNPQPECSLAVALKARTDLLRRLKRAVDAQPINSENRRRSKALRELIRNPKRPMTEEMCRDLGDAFFAFFAPEDSVILTTNLRDHEPLARAVGKIAARP
jgi:hypothetical protein